MKNNIIICKKHNCCISIDTMELTAKLSHSEIRELQNYFEFDNSSKSEALKHYEGVYHFKQYGFTMKVLPRIRQWRRYYNARITFHKAFFEAENLPESLMELVQMFNWSITNLHIAFDYPSHYKPMVYKHHHKVVYDKLTDANGFTTHYFGSRGSKIVDCEDDTKEKWIHRKNNIAILYDRNEKELAKGISDEFRHDYSKRYEARMIFKIGELQLSKVNHARVAQELDKRILIADLESSDIHEYAKRPLRKLQDDYSSMDKLVGNWKWRGKNPIKEKKQLKSIAMEHREPLVDMYLEHCEELFEVFNEPELAR
ncbi:hypothetical protein [Lysinibacillus xylanilyticus]|uniref:hypothetical protein n=1 Tax=Lysinibacillus xylanilyticus TaxID=582475 RepID=UPI00382C7D72